MRIKAGLTLTVLAACAALAWGDPGDEKEPALKYTLEVNGEKHEIVLGEPIELKGTFSDPKAILTAAPTRTFNKDGFEFEYPSAYSWEAEITGDKEKIWTLSGNDFKIMCFVQPEALTARAYAAAMAAQFGESTKQRDVERTLGGTKTAGRRLDVTLAGAGLLMEVYVFPGKESCRVLVLQDCPDDGDEMSEEARAAGELLAKTFKCAASPKKPRARTSK